MSFAAKAAHFARGESVTTNRGYKRYVLGTLTLVYGLNCLDMCLMTLLVQPIKEEMRLSDSQLGFLTGIAFALFYATLGLPIARWVDRGGNRVTITSLSIGLWGLTTMSCFFVTNFLQLVATRVAAGVGESGCMPATYSLIGDYFPAPAERTTAMTIYNLAGPVPVLASYVLGGWTNEHYGWRVAFLVMGIPGVLVAVLVKMTITEPRTSVMHGQVSQRRRPRIVDILAILWHQQASRNLCTAIILVYVISLGMSPWVAAFMIRSHGMHTTELGVWLGLICGLGGIGGILLGGYVAQRWFTGDERGQMRLCAVITASLVPCYILFLFLPQKRHALIALIPLIVVSYCIFGPIFALLQRLVADQMRATTLAVVMLFANLIGMGIGPQVVGILSDKLESRVGSDSLRYAMLTVSFVALWAAYHFWHAGRTVKEDLVRCEQDDQLSRLSCCKEVLSMSREIGVQTPG